MKFCYCDETGTGQEPYAVIVGVVVDAKRMHLTKSHWSELLSTLSKAIGKEIQELHTSNFYSGSGIWKEIDGPKRAEAITLFLKWFIERKHHLVLSAIDKEKFERLRGEGRREKGEGRRESISRNRYSMASNGVSHLPGNTKALSERA